MRCALRAEKCGRGKKGDEESGRKELTQRHEETETQRGKNSRGNAEGHGRSAGMLPSGLEREAGGRTTHDVMR